MAIQKVLVPYNFTPNESKALDFIISNFIYHKDVEITLFNSYTPLPEIDIKASPELQKMTSGILFLSQELKKKEEGLVSAKDHLLENGFSDNQVKYVFKERQKNVADEIIDMVVKGHYKMLVLTPKPGKVNRMFARSVHDKVLRSLKNVTICIAT